LSGYLKSLEAIQNVPYAASIDVNPEAGEYVIVGTLTGAITITAANGRAVGKRLTIDTTQDGTGGRVITWDAIFKAGGFSPNTGAGKRNVASFMFDGSNYILQSSAVGL
jgi:hypothetical protein